LYPFAAASSAATTSVETQQVLTIGNTTTSTNVFTTTSFICSSTTAGTNVITVSATSAFVVGQPVVFGSSVGGLTAGVVYYVLTIPSATTFTVSAVWNGAIVSLTTAFINFTVQETTSNLSIGMPIQFQGTTFGGVFYNTTYYVLTVSSSTTFTVSSTPNGTAFALTTATGTMYALQLTSPNYIPTVTTSAALTVSNAVTSTQPNTLQALTITATTASTNVFTTQSISITGATASTTSANGYLTTAAGGTNTLTTGMPVVFSGAVGTIVSGTVYYVLNVYSTTTFNISATLNGPAFTLSTSASAVTMQQATTHLQLNQPIMFTGTTFGNVATNIPYYVSTIPSTTTFTVATQPGGSVVTLVTSSGTMVTTTTQVPVPLTIASTSVTALTTAAVAVTATATTGLITSNTTTLATGQPIVFDTSFSTIVANTVYYVLNIASSTTFSISTTPNGSLYPLTATSGLTANFYHATTALQINQPIVFTGTTIGGITAGQIYYVQNIVSNTSFQISTTFGGAFFAPTVATGTMTGSMLLIVPTINIGSSSATTNAYTTSAISTSATSGVAPYQITCSSTATLSVGQPVVFTTGGQNIVAGTVYYVATIDSGTAFQISATYGGTPFALQSGTTSMTVSQATNNMSVGQPITFAGSAFGGVTAGVTSTTYYVASVPTTTSFTISTTLGGSTFALTSTTGTMVASIGPKPIPMISGSVSSNQLSMYTYAVTATAVTTNLITIASTYALAVGMPVVFSSSMGSLQANVVYYVASIPSGTTFTVSATRGGPVFIQTTATGSMNLQQATSILYLSQAMQFQLTQAATTYTGITMGTTYYVRSIESLVLFTLSATPIQPGSASPTVLSISGGTAITGIALTNNVITTLAYQTAAIAVTATSATSPSYPLTCTSTTTLSVGMPVVFDNTLGGITAGTTYYVNAILSSVTFNISATLGGPILATTLVTSITTLNVYQSTANLTTGQPVQFTGTTFGIPAALAAGQTYYIQSTPSYNTFTIALIGGSTQAAGASGQLGQGILPIGLTAAASGSMLMSSVMPVPPLFVTASTGSAPYTYTTANIAVTATSATGNTVTCASTSTLAIGMPVVFSSGLGNLVSGTVYYILTIPTSTTFTISATFNGTAFVQTSTTGSINVQQATTFLQVNQPVVFNGAVFGNASAATTYYILTVPTSTTFTITAYQNSTAVTLTATTGNMSVQVGPHRSWVIDNTTGSTLVPRTFTMTATAAMNGNNMLAVVNSTFAMYVGMPFSLSTSIGPLVAARVYYVTNVYDERRISVSLAPPGSLGVTAAYQFANGTALPLTTATGSATLYQSTSKLQINQAVVFYGILNSSNAVFGTGITSGTVYYITTQVGDSVSGSFSVAATPGGAAISVGTNGGSNAAMMMVPLLTNVTANNVYQSQVLPIITTTTSSNVLTVGNLTLVTGTAIGTNLITCLSTSALSIGMPIVFSAAIGSLNNGVTYYVLTINSATTFTVAQAWGGQVAILTNSYGGVYVQPSTANLSVGQSMVFTGSVFSGGTGLMPYTTYYVATIPSVTTFTLATTVNNALAGTSISITATANGYMSAYGSTAGLLANMNAPIAANAPITFVGATITVTAINGTTLYTPGNTGFLAVNQAVVFTGYTFISGITAGTIYYMQSIPTANTFTLSLTPSGAAITWATGTNTFTMQVVNPTGTALTPYTGYYVQSVPTPLTFTISSTSGGSVTPLSTSTGTVVVNSNIITLATGSSTNYFLPNQPVIFTNTAGTVFGGVITMANTIGLPYVCTTTASSGNVVTTSSTTNLIVGQPVVFTGATTGNVVAFQTYYIQSIASGTTFTLALTVGGAAITLTSTSNQLFYMIPAYYVKAVLNSSQIILSATPNGGPIAIGTGYASGTNILTMTPLPLYADFIEYDALIATLGILERTGILIPPNTYLYASSNVAQVNIVAIGIQELV
jgi:hypothetical protein